MGWQQLFLTWLYQPQFICICIYRKSKAESDPSPSYPQILDISIIPIHKGWKIMDPFTHEPISALIKLLQPLFYCQCETLVSLSSIYDSWWLNISMFTCFYPMKNDNPTTTDNFEISLICNRTLVWFYILGWRE